MSRSGQRERKERKKRKKDRKRKRKRMRERKIEKERKRERRCVLNGQIKIESTDMSFLSRIVNEGRLS